MKDKIGRFFIYIILTSLGIVTLLPFIWMISTSFKSGGEVFNMPPDFIPNTFHLENYSMVAKEIPIVAYFTNSVIIAAIVTIGTLITTILAAFAFSKMNFWGRDIIFSILIGTMMVPGELMIIPNFVTISKLGWLNTYKGLTVPWLISIFSVFLLRQYFLTIPKSLYYAAKLDGCSDFKFLWTIMVPISKPALITIALLKVVNSWNEFLWPLLITNKPLMRTLPVGIMNFTSEAGGNYHLLMAATTIVITPILIIYFVLQRYVISGITKSGIKG